MVERSDAELLASQRDLQLEAAGVLADLDLLAGLGAIGRPIITGSLALGLMTWRDIDVTTVCPSLALGAVLDIARTVALQPRVRRITVRNETGAWNTDPAYPDGLYLGADYRSASGHDWRLDLWFLAEGTTQFDLDHLVALPPRLTPGVCLAILRIKDAWHLRPEYGASVHSYDIYTAVLDHGVTTVEGFGRHLAERRAP